MPPPAAKATTDSFIANTDFDYPEPSYANPDVIDRFWGDTNEHEDDAEAVRQEQEEKERREAEYIDRNAQHYFIGEVQSNIAQTEGAWTDNLTRWLEGFKPKSAATSELDPAEVGESDYQNLLQEWLTGKPAPPKEGDPSAGGGLRLRPRSRQQSLVVRLRNQRSR